MIFKLTNEELAEVIREQEPVYLVNQTDLPRMSCSLIIISQISKIGTVTYRYTGYTTITYTDNISDIDLVVFRTQVEAVDYMLDTMETYTKRMIDALNIGIDRVNEYASRVRNYSKRLKPIRIKSISNAKKT